MKTKNGSEIDRRAVLKGTAAGMVGVGLAEGLSHSAPVEAQDRGALKDAQILTETVQFKSGADTINGFLARPKATGKHGAVVLIPGIFGVSEYMKEATAQLAQAGLVALCVDWYSRIGGAPKTDDFAVLRKVVTEKTPDNQIVGDGLAGISYLKRRRDVNGKVGVTGFCMGGRITLLIAANSPDVLAASPYYGPLSAGGPGQTAPMEVTAKIKAAVQGHYGATDMNPKPDDVRAFYAKLKETNPHAEYFIYEGAGHAFHDFSRPSFNKDASEKAWGRTVALFQQHLK